MNANRCAPVSSWLIGNLGIVDQREVAVSQAFPSIPDSVLRASGAAPAESPIDAREPADTFHNGAGSPRFYLTGRAVRGRPFVMVYKGDRAQARLGSFVNIGPDVILMVGGNHRIDWVSTFSIREVYDLPGAFVNNPWSRGDIEIGHDVTLARGVRVRSGVSIGDGAVVLPYTVVTRDIRPFAIVQGSPGREIGRRFSDEEVEQLSRLAWWHWPASQIRRELGPAVEGWLPDRGRHATVTESTPARRWDMALARVRRQTARALHRIANLCDPPSPPDPAAAEREPALDPSLLSMGRASYFIPNVRGDPSSGHRLTIGNYCSIAFDCEFVLDGSATPTPLSALALGLDPDKRLDARLRGGDIVVGADCWFARGTRVLPGVTIGPGAVVAGYSVVTEDVRPYAIVAGNPARETGRRFDDQTVDALLDIAWWDWPEDLVKQRYAEMCSSDIATFVSRYRRSRSR